ncbi:MAG: flavodoxin-dependent (E)-4-hydroxy-3-methylbut-2-enyl-diphosphate synthase, partial [Muribaculaceae bacterium]|nr:flavodoxin-dependent (E)-4-hydroxy-3-methylbut-2-enyl-diphosphate synthase [Muribaculaceae bacterium]
MALCLTTAHANPVGKLSWAVHTLWQAGNRVPVVARIDYSGQPRENVVLHAAADFGALLLNGLIDGVDIKADTLTRDEISDLALGILQAARCRVTKTEFVSCPGCGRTMFDLQSTVRRVKEAVAGFPGLKIAVMGCVVNGPGEMADADYGYVGAGVGRVSLYRGKQ